jgi:hypothetical protein
VDDRGHLFWQEHLHLRSLLVVVKKTPLMDRDVSVVLTGARLDLCAPSLQLLQIKSLKQG